MPIAVISWRRLSWLLTAFLAFSVLTGVAPVTTARPSAVLASDLALASSPSTLPPGFKLYRSKVLPYTIGYPPGWRADGSIFGSVQHMAGVYYAADTFSKRLVGTITIWSEHLPASSQLTSLDYLDVVVLDLQRAQEEVPASAYVATRLGTLIVGGVTAYVLGYTRGTGSDKLRTTAVVWVTKGRGWRAGLTTVKIDATHDALVPQFETMVQSFQLR